MYLGHSDEVTETLRKAIGDEDHELKKCAILAVTRHPKAKLLLNELTLAVNDADKSIALTALDSLPALGSDADPAIPTLLKAMKKPELRGRVALTFRYVGTDNPEVLATLLECLREKANADVAGGAAFAISKRSGQAKTAVPLLINLLDNKQAVSWGSTTVREYAATALGEIGPDAKDAVPLLAKLLTDPDHRYPLGLEKMKQALGKIDPSARRAVDLVRTRNNPTGEALPEPKRLP
jgi:HEAT repeat protein